MSARERCLFDLKVGARANITGVGGKPSVVLRLMEMGLLEGTEVEVTRVAPLGDPLELKLRGYRLSIRKEQAREIRVSEVQERSPAQKREPATRKTP